MEAVKLEGLEEDTVILFSSDNGGAGAKYNKPLRGRKEFLYEGGTRVVSLLSGAGIPTSLYPGMVHVTDWFATFMNLAGLSHNFYEFHNDIFHPGLSDQVPEDSNSINMMPQLRQNLPSPRTQIVHNIDEDQDKGLWQVVHIIFQAFHLDTYFDLKRGLLGLETSNLFGVKQSC